MNTSCEELKEIRRKIAKDNGIDIEIPDCDLMDKCTGTCPRCEFELQTLESELTLRVALGKVAVVAGMTLGLTAGMLTATAQNTHSEPKGKASSMVVNVVKDSCLFEGVVKDKESGETLLGANVILRQNYDIVAGTRTGIDGEFSIKVPVGKYELIVSYLGYKTSSATIDLDDTEKTGVDIVLDKLSYSRTLGFVVIEKSKVPLIDIGAGESGERIDADRIKHFPN
ncbi:MAG: carboxypeptidase-like regulatory domain-containing protein [Bacteroidales bacterium]|nr:carboxypeptidase-like regulatory domain-containing protein [Bacteroidales bacterium]